MTVPTERAHDVNNLMRDMAVITQIVERLDITLEKITAVSATVSSILAVQGNRLESQEKTIEKLYTRLEQQDKEHAIKIKEIYSYIEDIEKRNNAEHEKSTTKILGEIKALHDTVNKRDEEINNKIAKLEKWSWVAMGGAAVVGWLMSNAEKLSFLM